MGFLGRPGLCYIHSGGCMMSERWMMRMMIPIHETKGWGWSEWLLILSVLWEPGRGGPAGRVAGRVAGVWTAPTELNSVHLGTCQTTVPDHTQCDTLNMPPFHVSPATVPLWQLKKKSPIVWLQQNGIRYFLSLGWAALGAWPRNTDHWVQPSMVTTDEFPDSGSEITCNLIGR